MLLAAVLSGACAPAVAANPLLPGDHPDPSLLRTGQGWYATSTSKEWLPAFPILHSSDLAGWREVGSVLTRRPGWAATEFWAPALVRRGGRALVYYAAEARDGRRCLAVASAPSLRGPYRDHGPLLCSRVGEIDPLSVRDEQGNEWLLWKRDGNSRGRPTPILAAPLVPGGLSLAAPPQELFRADAPWEHRLIEAPALVRRHGLFYLLYSAGHCCGRHCNYVTGVARSASLLGPWEKRSAPILRGGAGFRCPGHAGVSRGPGGGLVLAYHAYVRGDPSNRQLFVAPLRFDAAGWPLVGRARGARARPAAARFTFAEPLSTGWEWPAGRRPRTARARGRLILGAGVLARQARTTRLTATAVLAAHRHGARAGLAVMGSEGNTVGLELRGRRAVAWRADDGRRSDAGAVRARRSRVVLRIAVGRRVRLAVRTPKGWRRVGRPQAQPRWAAGARIALIVRGGRAARAQFDSLSVEPRK